MAQELRERAHAHNPDNLPHPEDRELPPAIFQRLLDGKITAGEAHREADQGAEGRTAFNEVLREQASAGTRHHAAERFFDGGSGGEPPRDAGGRFAERES